MTSLLSIVLPVLLIELILIIVALVDLVRRDRSEVVFGVKWPWVLIILFISAIGPIVYLLVGRKRK